MDSVPGPHPSARKARRRLWFAFLFVVLAIGVGGAWDRAYHVTQPFDSFWSPPHLFIYSMYLLAVLVVGTIAFSRELRPWFGPGFRIPPLRFEVPGSLALLGAGLGVIAVAGGLDDLWHSNFGLDETGWSAPHAVLGWGLLVVVLGFVSCRLALRPYVHFHAYTSTLLGYLVLAFSVTPFLGPLYTNNTPDTVRAVASIPVLAGQPEFLHTSRIYLQWNLDRTHPLFAALAAVWAGAGLSIVRGIDPRPKIVLLVAGIATVSMALSDRGTARFLDQFFAVSSDPASWLPLPILPAAIAFLAARKANLRERPAWALAGAVFGVLVFLIWGRDVVSAALALLAVPGMVLGSIVGGRFHRILESPREWDVKRVVPLLGFGMPLLTGAVDLYLRAITP